MHCMFLSGLYFGFGRICLAKPLYGLTPVPRVRIPPSPPVPYLLSRFVIQICYPDLLSRFVIQICCPDLLFPGLQVQGLTSRQDPERGSSYPLYICCECVSRCVDN